MILGFLIGAVVGAFFGGWVMWTKEVHEEQARIEEDRNWNMSPWPSWTNEPYDRLHGRKP